MHILSYILFALVGVVFNVGTAYWHGRQYVRMSNGEKYFKIRHGWWGFLYMGLIALNWFLTENVNTTVALVLVRKPLFDTVYNVTRGLGIFFVSETTTSFIDQWHLSVYGKRSEVYQTIYFITSFILIMTA